MVYHRKIIIINMIHQILVDTVIVLDDNNEITFV